MRQGYYASWVFNMALCRTAMRPVLDIVSQVTQAPRTAERPEMEYGHEYLGSEGLRLTYWDVQKQEWQI